MNLIQALSTLDKGRSDLGTSVLLKGEVWADFLEEMIKTYINTVVSDF